MNTSDRIRLGHMLEAALDAVSFAKGRSRSDLETDRMLLLAIVRSLEVVGEAASQVSREFREHRSGLPWADVIGMRNRLIHAYFDVDPDIVWGTTTQDLPMLIRELSEILAEPQP
jgi:uncharacterized protein with HEPN domain